MKYFGNNDIPIFLSTVNQKIYDCVKSKMLKLKLKPGSILKNESVIFFEIMLLYFDMVMSFSP